MAVARPRRPSQGREGGLMNNSGWLMCVAVGMLGLLPRPVLSQPPLDVWVALPEASDGTPTREIPGAAASDQPDRVVLVSDEDVSPLYVHDLVNTTVMRLPLTTDAAVRLIGGCRSGDFPGRGPIAGLR